MDERVGVVWSIGFSGADAALRAGAFVPGTIKVSCKAIKGTKFYLVEARPHDDPTAPWVQVSVDSACRQTITGLTPGVEYALRMAAKGAAGQSPWGDEAVCRAP